MSFRDPINQRKATMSTQHIPKTHLTGIEWARSEAKDINVWKTRVPRRCSLCEKHSSKYRRECPVCHWLIAPGCYPKKCWSDELNHCRACHDLMELWKHSCCKMQYLYYHYGTCEPDRPQPTVHNCPVNLPVAIQVKIMAYDFPTKTFFGQTSITMN